MIYVSKVDPACDVWRPPSTRHLAPFRNRFWTKQAVKNNTYPKNARKNLPEVKTPGIQAISVVFPSLQIFQASVALGTVLSLERGHVKLPQAAFVVHVADLPENLSLFPALVMDATNGPHATCSRDTQWGEARMCEPRTLNERLKVRM